MDPDDRRSSAQEPDLIAAVACMLAAVILFGAGYAIWENIAENLHVVALGSSLACYIAGFVVICTGLAAPRYARAAAVAGILIAFTAQSSNYLFFKVPYYDSDALLFNAYSAQLLTEGIDPYTQSMEPGYRIFGVPEGEATPTVDGGTVFSLSYPALSFLIYVPFIWLGITNLLWVNVLGHLAALTVLFLSAPTRLKPLAPLALFLDPSYFEYTLGGVTDVLWVPFAMMTAMWWTRSPLYAAVALGVACCFKQTPWLIVPFALIAWILTAVEARRLRSLMRPALCLAGTFMFVNLPFIVWHPKSWLLGVLTPISGNLVMFGSGITQLVSAGILQVGPGVLSELSLGTLGVLLFMYALFPRRLGFLPFLAPGISYFFAPRSLENYFMYWPMVLIVYLFSNWSRDLTAARLESFTRVKALAAGLAALIVAEDAAAMIVQSHRVVEISVLHAWVDPVTNGVQRLLLDVRNLSSRTQQLRFNVTEEGAGYDYHQWLPKEAQLFTGHTDRRITITAPSQEAEADLDSTTATQAIAVQSNRWQEYSEPVDFGDTPPKLQNAGLTTWSLSRPSYPIAWYFKARDVHLGRLSEAFVGGKRAVRLHLPRSPERVRWRATMIGQLTDARAATLRFLLFPERDYEGTADPQRLFGAELRDVLGHEIYVTIDSRRHSIEAYCRGARVVMVIPGHLHSWNVVDVDLSRMRRQYGFALSPTATMLVSVVAVMHERSNVPLNGFFGGVVAREAPPSFVSLPQ